MQTLLCQHINKKNKNYMHINIVSLLLGIYVILYPFISKILQKINPGFGICPYLAMTGKNCPLCGGTRYIANISKAFSDIKYLFHPFGIIVLAILFEICFRIYILIKKKYYSKKIMKFDIIYHIIVTILFFGYEVIFLLSQN